MSERGRITTLRLINQLLKANASTKMHTRLRGSLTIRAAAIKRVNDLKAILRMAGDGYEGRRAKTDTTRSELRTQAGDARLSAEARVTSLERLMVLEGFLGVDTLGTDPTDIWVRSLVTEKKAEPAAKVETDIEAVLRKYREGRS